MDATRIYGDRVMEYISSRPGYPREIVDLITRHSPRRRRLIVADIGSGTGIFTEILLQAGCRVFAVEPNPVMRAAAEALLRDNPLFTSVAGHAEHTSLPSGSIDLVTAAQSFHWFDLIRSREEFKRILNLNGCVALVWNERRREGSPFLEELNALLAAMQSEMAEDPSLYDAPIKPLLDQFFGHLNYRWDSVFHQQTLLEQQLMNRIMSSSFAPSRAHPRYQHWQVAVQSLFRHHATVAGVCIEYNAVLARGILD